MTLPHLKIHTANIPFVIVICFIVDIVLCFSYIIDYTIGRPYEKLTILLNLSGEDSFAAWYSTVQLFCIFILGFIFARQKINANEGPFLLISLPIIFLIMSIDESVQIHEWLGMKSDIWLLGVDRSETPFHKTGFWMFTFGLPVLVIFLLWVRFIKHYISYKPSTFKRFIIGMVMILTGALGFDALVNFFENWLAVTAVMFEEGLEMIGATLVLWSVYDMTVEYLPDIEGKYGNT